MIGEKVGGEVTFDDEDRSMFPEEEGVWNSIHSTEDCKVNKGNVAGTINDLFVIKDVIEDVTKEETIDKVQVIKLIRFK